MNFTHPKIGKLFDFIKFYKNKFYSKFETEIQEITKNHKIMTMEEAILSEYHRVGVVEGMEKGKRIGVVNMLKKVFLLKILQICWKLRSSKF